MIQIYEKNRRIAMFLGLETANGASEKLPN